MRQLWQLIRRWWACDRIRISPAAGQLLRLPVGSFVTIGGVTAEIRQSRQLLQAESPGVEYICEGSLVFASLRVMLEPHSHRLRVWWTVGGETRELCEEEVQVWRGRERMRRP